MDLRYNGSTWVHSRDARLVVGARVLSDPETGEIIKGHVTLVAALRPDFLIAASLWTPYEKRNRQARFVAKMQEMALAG